MTQETQRRGSITPALARRIEIWPVDRLIPYVKNPRTHSEEQVAQIAASILEFGFTAPILVASDAGILAGHGRLLAAQKLGLLEVPVVVLDHLSETQRKAYVIADNQLALNAGWNLELLRGELESLKENDFDLDLVGFSDKELDVLLADPEDEERANAAPPLPENAVSRPGDLWICGERRNQHRVLCADATNPEAVANLLGERRPHLMVTDPPYDEWLKKMSKASSTAARSSISTWPALFCRRCVARDARARTSDSARRAMRKTSIAKTDRHRLDGAAHEGSK